MSSSDRVSTVTCGPSLWIWARMPSSFHSTPAGPVRASASGTVGADPASIGLTPWPTARVNPDRAAGPSRRRAAATRGEAAADGDRTAYVRGGRAGGAREGGQHGRLERSLAQAAAQQAR